jgi:hypothetical protein
MVEDVTVLHCQGMPLAGFARVVLGIRPDRQNGIPIYPDLADMASDYRCCFRKCHCRFDAVGHLWTFLLGLLLKLTPLGICHDHAGAFAQGQPSELAPCDNLRFRANQKPSIIKSLGPKPMPVRNAQPLPGNLLENVLWLAVVTHYDSPDYLPQS